MSKKRNVREFLLRTGMKEEAVHSSCEQLCSFYKQELYCRASAKIGGYIGPGNRSASIMVISDRPNETESKTKVVGFEDYATILTVMLGRKGINFRDVYWTLAVKEDTDTITMDMIQRHKAALRKEIFSVAPTLIITLGSAPITSILGERIHIKKPTIKYTFDINPHLEDVPILALPHPRTALFEDTETFRQYYRNAWKSLNKLID